MYYNHDTNYDYMTTMTMTASAAATATTSTTTTSTFSGALGLQQWVFLFPKRKSTELYIINTIRNNNHGGPLCKSGVERMKVGQENC